jgi:transcriptional regulator with XRE-family HTH domain
MEIYLVKKDSGNEGRGPRALAPDTPVMLPSRQLTREEFGRRLNALRLERGWNRSELARQTGKQLGREIGRDVVRNWCNGKGFPEQHNLVALAAALKVAPSDLLPNIMTNAAGSSAPAIEMRQVPGEPNTVWLRVNRAVPFKAAIEIMRIIAACDEAAVVPKA